MTGASFRSFLYFVENAPNFIVNFRLVDFLRDFQVVPDMLLLFYSR